MIKNLSLNKILFIFTGIITLIAAVMGILKPEMYNPVVSARMIPAIFTQDLVSVLAALVLIVLAILLHQNDFRKLIIVHGILGFFFYAYGIYSIEQVYTSLYPLYLTILACSFYVLIFSISNVDKSTVKKLDISPIIRYIAAGYGIFVAVMFNFIWLSQLIPLLQSGERIEYTFSVYIIDLAFVMPAFIISASLAIRKEALGLTGLPALFILGVGILSPLALAEALKPVRYNIPLNSGDFWLYSILSLSFLFFSAIYLVSVQNWSISTKVSLHKILLLSTIDLKHLLKPVS